MAAAGEEETLENAAAYYRLHPARRACVMDRLRDGLDFVPPTTPMEEVEWLRNWPERSTGEEADWLDLPNYLYHSLRLNVNLVSWIAAQEGNPTGILRALQNAPGFHFTENGYIYPRGAMGNYEGHTGDKKPHWLVVPYPLQLIDGKTGLMWTLLAGKDFFSAAARAPAGSRDHGTQQVRQITRVGARHRQTYRAGSRR